MASMPVTVCSHSDIEHFEDDSLVRVGEFTSGDINPNVARYVGLPEDERVVMYFDNLGNIVLCLEESD